MSEQKAVTRKEDPIYQMLAQYKGAIASVLPKHLTVERMLRIAYQMIYRTPKLRQCSPASLINGLIEISMLGLDIGRTAHMIPFKSDAVVIVDYKGFIELAHRSGQINSFPFKPVYESDYFEYEEGTTRYIKHKPAATNRGPLKAAYAIANFKHGGFDFEVVHPADIEAVKKVAPGAKSSDSPWNKEDQEWTMWCKTAVRRLAKRIPQSPELQRAVQLEDLIEAGLKQDLSHVTEELTAEPPIDIKPEPGKPEDLKNDINRRLNNLKGQTSHADNPDGDFKCPHCDFKGTSERGLKKHITQQHKAAENADNAPSEPNPTESSGQDTGESSPLKITPENAERIMSRIKTISPSVIDKVQNETGITAAECIEDFDMAKEFILNCAAEYRNSGQDPKVFMPK